MHYGDAGGRVAENAVEDVDGKDKDYIGSVTAEVLDEGRFTVLTVPAPVEIEKLSLIHI